MPIDPFSWTQIVPWLLSGVSLGWNYFNTKKTTRIQQDVKTLDRRIEEFRRLRTSVDAALSDLVQRRDALASLVSSGNTLASLRDQVQEEQEATLQVYFTLDSVLRRVDASSFVAGNDWQELLNSRWDPFGDKLNGVYRPRSSRADVQRAIQEAKDALTSIVDAIESRLDKEMTRLLDTGGK